MVKHTPTLNFVSTFSKIYFYKANKMVKRTQTSFNEYSVIIALFFFYEYKKNADECQYVQFYTFPENKITKIRRIPTFRPVAVFRRKLDVALYFWE